MTQSGQLVQVRRLIDAFHSHSADAVAAFMAENISWRRGDGVTVEGWAAVGARLGNFFTAFPDAALTPVRTVPFVPNTVLVEWVLVGTHSGHWRPSMSGPNIPPTGRRIRITGADLLGFNPNGEIAWDDARIDTASLFDQLAHGPTPEPDPDRLRAFADRYTEAWCSAAWKPWL